MTKKTHGFTVIELIFIIVIAGIASVLFFIQKNDLQIIANDDTKKTAINAIYYSLEEVYYANNKYYPQTVDSNNLKSVDPVLFTGPNGVKLGTAGSDYSYSPTNCSSNQCKSYTLKATLEKEADYIKTSRNN